MNLLEKRALKRIHADLKLGPTEPVLDFEIGSSIFTSLPKPPFPDPLPATRVNLAITDAALYVGVRSLVVGYPWQEVAFVRSNNYTFDWRLIDGRSGSVNLKSARKNFAGTAIDLVNQADALCTVDVLRQRKLVRIDEFVRDSRPPLFWKVLRPTYQRPFGSGLMVTAASDSVEQFKVGGGIFSLDPSSRGSPIHLSGGTTTRTSQIWTSYDNLSRVSGTDGIRLDFEDENHTVLRITSIDAVQIQEFRQLFLEIAQLNEKAAGLRSNPLLADVPSSRRD